MDESKTEFKNLSLKFDNFGHASVEETNERTENRKNQSKVFCLFCGKEAEVVADGIIDKHHWYMQCKHCGKRWSAHV